MRLSLWVLFVCSAVFLSAGFSSAGMHRQGLQGDTVTRPEHRHGSNLQEEGGRPSSLKEEELLNLLDELAQGSALPASRINGKSVARQKYSIARRLRQFDDGRAEEALRSLIAENACEGEGEGEVFCVSWGAVSSLQEVQSTADLKKLTADAALAEQLVIIKKYGVHPHTNDFASHVVMDFLIVQSRSNPRLYVPLLVEYFPCCPMIMPTIEKYPQEANLGLRKTLSAASPTVVWAGINLARTLRSVDLFPLVYGVAFDGTGAIDYARQGDVLSIQLMALGFFRLDEQQAISYYERILFGDFQNLQAYVVSGIADQANPDLLDLLQRFSVSLQGQPETRDELFLARLAEKIALMVEAQQ